MEIIFHADDYAASAHISQEILTCIREGDIRSISIMPNMSCFEESMEMLTDVLSLIKASVHLNIMEGYCVSRPQEIPLLADETGLFTVSWGKLLCQSLFKRKELARQLKTEFKAQIERIYKWMPKGYRLRVDSHQHPHMIPAVFCALLEVIQEENYETEYIRIASERLKPFLVCADLWNTFSVSNVIKNILLNLFAVFDRKKLLNYPDIGYCDFMGLVFSGCMDEHRVQRVLPKMLCNLRDSRNYTGAIEVLFHPGRMLRNELNKEYNKEGFTKFHLSRDRMVEEAAVKSGLYERIR